MLEYLSEANIQAEFYHQCKLLGIRCVLEFRTPAGRLDCAIVNQEGTHLIVIIECKRESERMWLNSKQINRYKTIGVPVIGLCKMSECESLAKRIKSEFISGGILLSDVEAMPYQERRKKRKFNIETDLDDSIIYRKNTL